MLANLMKDSKKSNIGLSGSRRGAQQQVLISKHGGLVQSALNTIQSWELDALRKYMMGPTKSNQRPNIP
jgi:hypothetical protein